MCGRKNETVQPEVESLSFSPTVKCGICGAMAASVKDVCTPVSIFEEEQLT
jgi:transcription elongation factor Elf1